MNDASGRFRDLDALLAAVCDQTAGPDDIQRIESLAGDAEGIEHVLDYLHIDGLLRWEHGSGVETSDDDFDSDAQTESAPVRFDVLTPPIIVLTPDASQISFFNPQSPFATGLVSYAAALLIMCAALLGAWAYKINHFEPFAKEQTPSINNPDVQIVARITGVKDCVCAADQPQPYIGSATVLGRKYTLSSGLLEITYTTGVRVILEGPCVYRVDSNVGGRLQLGKLVARVEKKAASGQCSVASVKPQAAKSQSPITNSQSLATNSLFSVRTPTAIITDLGTEFGVEVNANGDTTSHVFCGSVKMRAIGKGKQEVVLEKNESAQVGPGTDRIAVIHRETAHPKQFVRWMPRQTPIVLFNTGDGLKEGDSDPHWQLVAASNDPKFKPQSAVVISVIPAWYLRNDPARSQWISTCWHTPPPGIMYMPALPHNVTYTFRTMFDLTNAILESVVLRGQFIADSRVSAIRLNGTALPIPEHGDVSPFNDFRSFVIREEFVEGTNVLEFDVFSGYPTDKNSKINFMAFRVELNGFVLQDQRDHSVKKESGR